MPQLIIPGGWDTKEVSAAHRALVMRELTEDANAPVGPFAAFRWAMQIIGMEYGSLLDAGCGSGHYGVLCERFFTRIKYHGTDASILMTDYARELVPLGRFSVCSFEDNRFGDYDIVLASQVLEMLDDPPAMLDLLLSRAREYVILNRIRLTNETSHRIAEHTYCGVMGRNWLWNLDALTRRIEGQAVIMARRDWDGQCTFVIRVEHGESAELCSCANTGAACQCAAY